MVPTCAFIPVPHCTIWLSQPGPQYFLTLKATNHGRNQETHGTVVFLLSCSLLPELEHMSSICRFKQLNHLFLSRQFVLIQK